MAKSKRENIGVELYGFQQGLAKLQMQLEATHQNYLLINKTRAQVPRSHATAWEGSGVCLTLRLVVPWNIGAKAVLSNSS